MLIGFFEKEVKNAQSRFNKTFGVMTVCDLKTRHVVILSIIGMDLLAKKIRKAGDNDLVKDEISIFIQKKESLNRIFKTIEKHLNERRKNEKRNITYQGIEVTEAGNVLFG